MFRPQPTSSLARQVLLVQAVLGLVVVVLAAAMVYRQASRLVEVTTRTKVLEVANAIAATDDVVQGLRAPDPAAALHDLAAREMARTSTDFVVIMTTDGTRYTHPDQSLVGGKFTGSTAAAAAGGTIVEDYTGSLGPSTRAVVPVVADGKVIGLVSVGIRRTVTGAALRALIPDMLVSVAVVGVISGLGALVIARRVRRQTLGLNAQQLSRMHDHHDAVLHAVQEGLLIVGVDGRLQVANVEAQRLLDLTPSSIGRRVVDLGLSDSLVEVLTSGGRRVDEQHASTGRILLVSCDAVRRGNKIVATLTTLRDRTELAGLTGELGVAKSLADALSSQAHESANRLHTVVTMVELGRTEDAVRFATDELRSSQQLSDAVIGAVDDPAVAALLLGKVAQAGERGVTLLIDPDAHLPAGVLPSRQVVTIVGNLLDNAMDALCSADDLDERTITVDVQTNSQEVLLTVADTGPGLVGDDARRAFSRGWTTKTATGPSGRGLGLALVQQAVTGLGGTIEVSEPPGAVFTMSIPVPSGPSSSRSSSSGAPGVGQS